MPRFLPGVFLGTVLGFVLATGARAEAPPDPLRLVPEQADLIAEVKQPGKLIEAYHSLDLPGRLQGFQAVREFLDSTNYRRFYQLVAYYERELGGPWPTVVERVAGGGVVLGIKFGPDPAPVLLVIQGTDAAAVKKFADLTLQVIEQELARQESKDRLERATYREVPVVGIGKQFRSAVVGSAILVSNNDDVMKRALDLYRDGPAKSLVGSKALARARKLVPADPLAFLWANLEPVHKLPQAKETFKLPRDNFLATIPFGGYLDVIGRAPFAAVGLHKQGNTLLLRARLPAGRDGMPEGLAVHVPAAGQPGTRPLLEPKDVLFSTSFYLDVGKFWSERTKLFNPAQVKSMEDFDKSSAPFLAGTKFSELLTWAGPYQRFVAAHQADYGDGYQTRPKQFIPAFAVVSEMREPEKFSKAMETVLRGVALLAGNQAKLKLVEEKHGDCTLVGYRFPEQRTVPQDAQDIRYNFSPCFATVGNQFAVCSTLKFGHELVDLLQKEAKDGAKKSTPAAVRTRFYGPGAAAYLKAIEPILLTQAILDQALPPGQAREEVKKGLDLVRQLGPLQLEDTYGNKDFRVDIRLTLGKKK